MTTSAPLRHDPLDSLPRLDRHKPKCGPVRPSKVSRKRAYVLIGVHVLIGLHVLHWKLTGSTLTPMEPSEAMQTFEVGYINAGFVLFAALILSTLIFGRWFCGWGCHVVALQDLSAWLLGRLGLKPRPVRSRLLVFAPFVVAGHMFVWPHVEHWLAPEKKPMRAMEEWEWRLTTEEFWATFPGPWMTVLTVVVVGFLVVWWLGAKGFCTHGCPYGAFFSVADRFAPMRIVVDDSCDACGHCTSVCTSNVRVHEEVAKHGQIVDPGCMKCMDCVSVCPKEALSFRFAAPKPLAISQNRVFARADFTWPEEFLLAGVALLATLAFRGAWLGDHVPFLLSVGLGSITAVLALIVLRLLRRRDVAFQHTSLKTRGGLTGAGKLAAGLSFFWLLLFADLSIVWWHRSTAKGIREELASWEHREERKRELLAHEDALEKAEKWELFVDPQIQIFRGLAQRDLAVLTNDPSRFAAAEVHFRRAMAVWPDALGVLVPLADVLHVTDRDAEAMKLLERAESSHPGSREVQMRLKTLRDGPR